MYSTLNDSVTKFKNVCYFKGKEEAASHFKGIAILPIMGMGCSAFLYSGC